MLRGISSDFKGECNGSDKRFAFNIPAKNSEVLHLFESAIDLLYFATLQKLNLLPVRLFSSIGIIKAHPVRRMASPIMSVS